MTDINGAEKQIRREIQRQNTRPFQVLIVDDDESILKLVVDVLGSQYQVQTADNATLGLDLLAGNRYDLLVLDLGMPGLSGIDAIARIRAESLQDDLPILVISAFTELRRLVGDLRVDAILAKPFSVSQLEAQTALLIGRRASRASPPLAGAAPENTTRT